MSLLERARLRLGSRLEWRLLTVFLAAALLPLAVSDWIMTSVVSGVVQHLALDRDSLATRTTSRQVLDRLMLARTLLVAVDNAQGAARDGLVASEVGEHRPFSDLACAGSAVADYAGLSARWATARSGTSAPTRAVSGATLRVAPNASGNAGLLMATTATNLPHCIAVLNPDYLWEPVRDQSDSSTWRVRMDDGTPVVSWRGADALARIADRTGTTSDFSAHLFLMAEFGAGNWTLQQSAAPPVVSWYGMPVGAWLLCVAAATLLLIGLVARRTIRRTLLPLEALAEGSRRLAAGIAPTRVDVQRTDELGRLAAAFNEMAAQLEQRFASLQALARIDAGILQGAPFADLAGGALARLALLSPEARIAIAWRLDATRVAVIQSPPSGSRVSEEEVVEESPASMAGFERIEDGTVPVSSLAALQDARLVPRDAGVSCQVLGVRDDGSNRALIVIPGDWPDRHLAEARALRDRLAVAVVARAREDQLEHRATHDLLTGLRNAFGLQRALAPLLAADDEFAVLFVDLDHFKDVNDRYGHAVGDRLLQAAARRLRQHLPREALVSRNGGDEFVVILPASDAGQASRAADQILEALHVPFIISTTEHRTGASIGIAMYPAHGLDRDELLRCADIAMYESKREGRNRATLFHPALDTQIRERIDLLSSMVRGLERSEFLVYYQPRLDATTGAVVAVEALVRWAHPERGLLLPGLFIDLAETSGLIDALGLFVMEAAIAQIAAWQRDGLSIERVSVNVSQHQFASGALVPKVRELLRRHGVSGKHLEIEVTESVLGGDIASVRHQLHELRSLGAAIAMDDFGTGYSSLSQLRTLPIDVMKIDRAFVKDLETDVNAVAIARTIVTLARALGLRIVAEGVETPAQAALLFEMGCDQFQGFLYAKALPADECARLSRFEVPAGVQ